MSLSNLHNVFINILSFLPWPIFFSLIENTVTQTRTKFTATVCTQIITSSPVLYIIFSKLRFYESYLEKPYIAYNVDLLPKEILAFSTFRNVVFLFVHVTLYQCLLLPNFLEVVKKKGVLDIVILLHIPHQN